MSSSVVSIIWAISSSIEPIWNAGIDSLHNTGLVTLKLVRRLVGWNLSYDAVGFIRSTIEGSRTLKLAGCALVNPRRLSPTTCSSMVFFLVQILRLIIFSSAIPQTPVHPCSIVKAPVDAIDYLYWYSFWYLDCFMIVLLTKPILKWRYGYILLRWFWLLNSRLGLQGTVQYCRLPYAHTNTRHP